jgi:hypothetical protein
MDSSLARSEIKQMSSAIQELQARPDWVNQRLSRVTAGTTEIENDRLFAEARRLSEAPPSRSEMQSSRIFVEAGGHASRIVRKASEQVQLIRRLGQQNSPTGTGSALELRSAMGAFARVNGGLIKDLDTLNTRLARFADRGLAAFAQPPSVMGSV